MLQVLASLPDDVALWPPAAAHSDSISERAGCITQRAAYLVNPGAVFMPRDLVLGITENQQNAIELAYDNRRLPKLASLIEALP